VTTWERLAIPSTLCGGCGHQLKKGDAILVLTIGTVRKVRCGLCSGPVPPDLPAFVERSNTITPTPLHRFAPVLQLGSPLADFRARAAGDREPGCDDD